MCRCRMGNPKKMSRFICLKHCGENHVLDGLQRGGHLLSSLGAFRLSKSQDFGSCEAQRQR